MKDALIATAIVMFAYGIMTELYRSFPKFKNFMNVCMHALVITVSIAGAAIGISSYGLLGIFLGLGWPSIFLITSFFKTTTPNFWRTQEWHATTTGDTSPITRTKTTP